MAPRLLGRPELLPKGISLRSVGGAAFPRKARRFHQNVHACTASHKVRKEESRDVLRPSLCNVVFIYRQLLLA
jgi:hypothetical protein